MARPKSDLKAARARLLAAAEELLSRHGPNKVTVCDVAAACGMSQSNAYRFFPSKAALLAGVAARWFEEIEQALEAIAVEEGDARGRIMAFVLTQLRMKRARLKADPVMFQAYLDLGARNVDLVWAHVARISGFFEKIVEAWLQDAGLEGDARAVTTLIEDATLLFRDPNVILRRHHSCTDERARAVVENTLIGLERQLTKG